MSDFRWTTIRLVLQKTFDRPLSLVVGGTMPNRRPPIERTNSCQLIILLLGAHLSRGPGRVRRPAGQPEFTFFDAHSRFFAQPRALVHKSRSQQKMYRLAALLLVLLVVGATADDDGVTFIPLVRDDGPPNAPAAEHVSCIDHFFADTMMEISAAKISSSSLSTMTGSSAASSPRARRQRAAMERPSTAATPIRWPRGPWASRALCA